MPSPRLTLGSAKRLHGNLSFARVFAGKMRKTSGPLTFWSIPNDLGRVRLGLSVSRRVGTAVVRTKITRLLREAFRLRQHEWPGAYDVVIVVHPHETRTLSEYQAHLMNTAGMIHAAWRKRNRDL